MNLPVRRHFPALIAILFPILTFGQQKDFQLWISRKANADVFNNFEIHLEQELRFRENWSQTDRQVNDIGISYKCSRHFRAAFFYRLESDWKTTDQYIWRNAIFGEVTGKINVRRFTAGYRFRLQTLKRDMYRDDESWFNGFRHRHKLSVEYDIKGIPLVPFVDHEVFFLYSPCSGGMMNGNRTWAGLEYTIKKRHSFTLKYGIDREWNDTRPFNAYIIYFGYSIDLNLINQSKE